MIYKLFRTVFSFPILLGAVLMSCTYHIANRGIADPDIWWHLRNAEYLLKTHHFIRADMYSYTVNGLPWINHEWLAEIPYYCAWRMWGLQGIFLVMICLIEAIMLGTYYLGYMAGGNAKSAFLASWIAMFLATVSFGPRTLLFGWAYLIVLLSVLWRYRQRGEGPLWVLPPLFLLWVNSHGSWLIGMVVLWIFIVSGLFSGMGDAAKAMRWRAAQLKGLLRAAAFSMLALFVNPYGYRLVLYPFDFAFRQNLNVSNVEEWASVDFHGLRGKILLASVVVVLVMKVIRKQQWSLESLALFVFALYASVTYSRFLFLAGIIFTPLLAVSLDMIPAYRQEKDKPLINAAFMMAALLFVALRFPSESSLEADIQNVYPGPAVAALQALVRQNPGPVMHDYLWGGYMIWQCRDVPVFIDSRVDIFEYNGIVKEYFDFTNLRNSFEILDKYKVRYALLEKDSAQAYLLAHVSGWRVVYSDRVATIFERVP